MNASSQDQLQSYLLRDDDRLAISPSPPAPTNAASGAPDVEIQEIERARRDPVAFAPLYARYVDAIYGYCVRRVSDPELAADLTSQIFTRALTALPRYRPGVTPGTFRSWLFSIAHNLVIDTHRTRREMRSLDADSAPSLRDPAPSPEDHALRGDTRRAIREALAELTPGQRQIVELRLAGLTGPEIAGVLGMHLTAVKSGQFRAYARLRDLLRPHVASAEGGSIDV